MLIHAVVCPSLDQLYSSILNIDWSRSCFRVCLSVCRSVFLCTIRNHQIGFLQILKKNTFLGYYWKQLTTFMRVYTSIIFSSMYWIQSNLKFQWFELNQEWLQQVHFQLQVWGWSNKFKSRYCKTTLLLMYQGLFATLYDSFLVQFSLLYIYCEVAWPLNGLEWTSSSSCGFTSWI